MNARAAPERARAQTAARARHAWLLVAVIALGGAFLLACLHTLPPGQYLDEALANLLARDHAAAGHYPVYIASEGGGYHPAYIYLTRLARALTGGHVRAARYGIAALSLVSVPFVYAALRAVFGLDEAPARARWLALAGTLATATCVPLVVASRTGAEASLPLLPTALTFLFLALGLKTGRRAWHAAAGAALGAALYTYYSARLLPVAVAAALAWVALAERPRRWRARVLDLAVVAGAAGVVALPLLVYFAANPEVFLARAANASGDLRGGGALGVLGSGLRTAASLVVPGLGDVRPRHNLPARPLFDAFWAVMLMLGAALAARGWRRPSRALLLCWAAALLLPAVLTLEDHSPHFTRLLLAVPALAGLAALGLAACCAALAKRSSRLAESAVAGGLLFSVTASGLAVFGQWANHPSLYEAFVVQDWLAADLAEARAATHHVYLSPELLGDPFHPTLGLRLSGGGARDYPGPGCLVFRTQAERPQTFITYLPRDDVTQRRLEALFPQGTAEPAIVRHPDFAPEYGIFSVPAGAAAALPAHPAGAVFGGQVRLLGYELEPAEVRAGETVRLTLYWQALAAPLPEWLVFVHLYWPGGERGQAGVPAEPLAQSDGAPCGQTFATTRWQAGEIVVDERWLTVPADYDAEAAALVVGLYAWPSLERLPVAASAGLLSDARYWLTNLPVVR